MCRLHIVVLCVQCWTLPYNDIIYSQASSRSKSTCTGILHLLLSNTKLILLYAHTQTCYPRPIHWPSRSYKDCLALILSECLLQIYQSCHLVSFFFIRLSTTWTMLQLSSVGCDNASPTLFLLTQYRLIWEEGISTENIPQWNGMYNGLLGTPLCSDK